MSRFTQCEQCKTQVYGYPRWLSGWVLVHNPPHDRNQDKPLNWENGSTLCSATCLAAWALKKVEAERKEEAERDERRREDQEATRLARAVREAVLSDRV